MIFVPNHLRITKLTGANSDDWVLSIKFESVSSIKGVCNVLGLLGSGVECIHGNNSVCLVGEETRSVVDIDNDTSTEDLSILFCKYSDLLILPGVQITCSCMTPVLISSNGGCWVICILLALLPKVYA